MRDRSVDIEVQSLARKTELQVETARLWIEILKERVSLFKQGSLVGSAGLISSILSILLYYFFPGNVACLLPLMVFLGLLNFRISHAQVHIIHVR